MALLVTQPHFHQPGRPAGPAYGPGDDFYEQLMRAHHGLDDAGSRLLNARLILLLANHIGDLDVLAEALRAARGRLGDAPAGTEDARPDSPLPAMPAAPTPPSALQRAR